MRVLIVSQMFWPESFRINDVAAGLRERGHDVVVLTGLPNYPGGSLFEGYRGRSWWRRLREDYRGVRVLRVPLVPRAQGRAPQLIANYLSFAVSASIAAPALLREHFDAMLVFQTSPVTVGIPAVVAKALLKTPLAFWVQDLWPESLAATGAITSPRALALVAVLVRWLYRRSDRILVQSRAFVEPIVRLGGNLSKIVYLPNSAEAFYRPVDVPPNAVERRLLPLGFRVMFAGNLGIAQDLSTVLDAAELLRDLPEVQWILVGDGSRRAWVEAQIRERGLESSVHLPGSFPAEKMPTFFALADVLLVTLKRNPIFASTIPSKVQSYLACARPLVGALDGAGAQVIEEAGAGLTGPAEDAAALAEAVRRLYQMTPSERDEMGRRGRQYFEQHFERERLLDRLEDLLVEMKATRAMK